MSKKDVRRPDLKNIRKLQVLMILGYALIVIGAVLLVSLLAMRKTDEVLKNKVINLTSSLNVQMKLNMDSYLSRMETIAMLAFGEEQAYTYDATDPDNDEYEAINTEKVITEKLFSLCIMENFVDYGIVYRNNRTVGKISNGTMTLFGDRMFTELSSMISRPRTNDGWAAGYNNDYKRIYYVKQVHDNAVLFISFYASELDAVFDNPETLSDMEITLVDSDYNMIYSERSDEVGSPLPEALRTRIEGRSSASVMDNDYLVTVNNCGEWYVVCSIPTSIILNEKNEMQWFIYATATVAMLLAILLGLFFSYRITNPIMRIVSTLDTKASADLLTGVFNKRIFEEYAGNCLENSLGSERRALIIIDIDNFKGVNDTLGHSGGDKVLERTGQILREIFTEDDYLGRVGGDEFCVLVNSGVNIADAENYKDYIAYKCEQLCETFRSTYAGSDSSYKISVSIGAAVSPGNGRTFSELYAACDKALYESKRVGKDTYRFSDVTVQPAAESEGEL